MNIALIAVAGLLGLIALGSAAGKLRRVPSVVESMHSVGVSDSQMRGLALIEILGALGLVIGIWIPVLGTLAAAGLAIYFAGAVVAHVRAKDSAKELAPALVILLIAVGATALELAR